MSGRRGIVGALIAVAALALVPQAARADVCDIKRHEGGARRAPLIMGDSTLLLATPMLARRHFEADARACRPFTEGLKTIAARRHAGTLPRLTVLALGANGGATRDTILAALTAVGRDRYLGLVTPRNSAPTSAAMRSVARSHPDRVILLDWVAYSAGHPGWFFGDGLHVSPAGARALTDWVARKAEPLTAAPVKALRVPRTADAARPCDTLRRGGRTLHVYIVRGEDRVTCARARALARTAPPAEPRGWRAYDWSTVSTDPWRDVYARADRRVVVATSDRRQRVRSGAAGRGSAAASGAAGRGGIARAAQGGLALQADVGERGRGVVRVSGVAGSAVELVEIVGGERVPVAGFTLADTARAVPVAWRCDRRARRFEASTTDAAGAPLTATAKLTTPSCATRFTLIATPRTAIRAGTAISVRARDSWRRAAQAPVRVCLQAVCKRFTAPGSTRLNATRPGLATLTLRGDGVDERLRLQVRARTSRLKLLATGDSMMQIVDSFLAERLGDKADVHSDARISTGISKPLMLDWVAHAKRQSEALHPQVTLMFIGANDGFAIGGAPCCDETWIDRYAARARRMMASYRRAGAGRVYWLALPAPRDAERAKIYRAVNAATRKAAATFAPDEVSVIDLDRTFTPGFKFRGSIDGATVRQADGVHLSTAGARIAATVIERRLRADRLI